MICDITPSGQIIRHLPDGRTQIIPPRIKNGYHGWYDNAGKFVYLHRQVAERYLPNPSGYPLAIHIDGDKTQNSVDNLRWADSMSHNLVQARGSEHHSAKLVEENALEIRALRSQGKTYQEIADKYGVSYTAVWNCCNNKSWCIE